ncbi:MAG: trimethylamine methyltransferase family protein [Deltaproteobacteria bacterium]|jgi:trimethylamine--corrinoid protein Co-methyltransferase|nr:trimethylamine methyltransferase family protein [Deltaproteobacteria bacterium]
MIRHPEFYLEKLDQKGLGEIISGSLWLMEKTGLLIQDEELAGLIGGKGIAGVEVGRDGRLRLKAEKTMELLALAPPVWTFQARKESNSRQIGGDRLCVSPGYGSTFVADLDGRRREATLDDFRSFVGLSQISPAIDICSAVVVEPSDVLTHRRPEIMTAIQLVGSDKPIMGSVMGAEGAERSFRAAEIILGDLAGRPWLLGLININSPLRLDRRMAGALRAYLQYGQPVIFTPGASMGITGPVTVAGNMAQSYADLMGAVAVSQIIRPGHPVIVGNGGFGGNLHTGNPGYGRPENALATIIGAQVARKLRLPYRCSAAVTSSLVPDGRTALEHAVTAMAAWNGGASLALQAAGILDSINSMSFEQFVMDLELWGYIERLGRPVETDPEHLCLDLISQTPSSYLSAEHTIKNYKKELYAPLFGKTQKIDAIKDITVLAGQKLDELKRGPSGVTPCDREAMRALGEFVSFGEPEMKALVDRQFDIMSSQ